MISEILLHPATKSRVIRTTTSLRKPNHKKTPSERAKLIWLNDYFWSSLDGHVCYRNYSTVYSVF